MPLNQTAALLAIATSNFDRLVEFYQQLLNQSPLTFIPNVYAEFDLPGVKLGIFRPKEEGERSGDRRQETEVRSQESGKEGDREEIQNSKFKIQNSPTPPPTHSLTLPLTLPLTHPSLSPIPFSPLGMSLCLEVESLEGAIAHLSQLGYPPPGEILTASHGREIYAYDPDGNWLILHQRYSTNDLQD